MKLNQILNMVMRQLTRRAVNFGINKGVDTVARRGKSGATSSPTEKAASDKMAKNSRQAVKRARQAARMTRKLGR